MSLEQAIHARWAGDSALTALVPDTAFATGQPRGNTVPPFVTLARVGHRDGTRTSTRTVDQVSMQFVVRASDLGSGKQIAAAIRSLFDGAKFVEAGTDVLRARRVDQKEEVTDDGSWRLLLQYLFIAIETMGA